MNQNVEQNDKNFMTNHLKMIKELRAGTSEEYRVLDETAMKELGQYQKISFKNQHQQETANEWSRKLQPMAGDSNRRLQSSGTTVSADAGPGFPVLEQTARPGEGLHGVDDLAR